MTTNLRTPVGAHLIRTVEATDAPTPVDLAVWRGIGWGLLLAAPCWAVVWVLWWWL